jgi:hypothetical protein
MMYLIVPFSRQPTDHILVSPVRQKSIPCRFLSSRGLLAEVMVDYPSSSCATADVKNDLVRVTYFVLAAISRSPTCYRILGREWLVYSTQRPLTIKLY